MKILADTHSLFWYFTANRRLSKIAKNYIDEAENIFVPTVILAELLYLFNKKNKQKQFFLILSEFKDNGKFIITSLDIGIIETMIQYASSLEIHDAAIVATASVLDIKLLTKDRTISKIYKYTIW